jgi:hypothetical protein
MNERVSGFFIYEKSQFHQPDFKIIWDMMVLKILPEAGSHHGKSPTIRPRRVGRAV